MLPATVRPFVAKAGELRQGRLPLLLNVSPSARGALSSMEMGRR